MDNRNCNECVYSTRDGFCRKFECAGTVTVEDIKAETIDEFADALIKIANKRYMYELSIIDVGLVKSQLKEQNNAE